MVCRQSCLTGHVTGDHGQFGSAQAEAAGATASWTDPTAMRLTTISARRRFTVSSLDREMLTANPSRRAAPTPSAERVS
jgi:hypothetical protein